MVKFYREALSQGIKPIIGVDLLVAETAERRGSSRLTLLCQTQEGYRNVTRLVTRAYLEGQKNGPPMVERSWLTAESLTGLIALSGGAAGDIGCALVNGRPRMRGRSWSSGWPVRRSFLYRAAAPGRRDEENYIAAAVELAAARGVPVVATNDVRFLAATDFETHEARVCIQGGAPADRPGAPEAVHAAAVPAHPGADVRAVQRLPEAVANTVQIARRCNLVLNLGQPRLPDYPVPAGMTTEQFLQSESVAGLAARLAACPRARGRRAIASGWTWRLKVICQMGFAGYFLIVADFIRWARENACRWGPGAARAPARWWPMPGDHGSGSASNTTCCSSAS